MNLIKINLLPYREMREQQQKKDFQKIMAFGAIIGVGACILIYSSLTGIVASQNGRNENLEAGIAVLDGELKEINELNKRKHDFLVRKQKVEELDNKRFEGARIIDTLNQLVPDGTYIIKIDASGNGTTINDSYTITGKAISDNKVATLMTALPSTGIFETPQLISIKKTDDGQEFVLKAGLVQQKIAEPPADPNANQQDNTDKGAEK